MKQLILLISISIISCQNPAQQETDNNAEDSITLNLPLLETSQISNPKPSKDTFFFPPIGFGDSEKWEAKIKNTKETITVEKTFSTTDGVAKVGLNGIVSYFFDIEYQLKYKNQTKVIKKSQFKNELSDEFYKNTRLESQMETAYTQNGQIFMDFGICEIPEYGDSCIFIPTVVF